MSMFEHNYDYDQDYQTYLDWKHKQAELDKEYDLAEEYERDVQGEKEEVETTGERCVREAQEEEDVRQLAQVTVGGVYRYELEWLPETGEVRVEVDQFPDGSPLYLWYPDYMGTTEVLSKILNIPEEKIRITGLAFFTKGAEVTGFTSEFLVTQKKIERTWPLRKPVSSSSRFTGVATIAAPPPTCT